MNGGRVFYKMYLDRLMFNNVLLLWYTLEHFYGNLYRYCKMSLCFEENLLLGSEGGGNSTSKQVLCSYQKVLDFVCENFASIYKNVLYTFISNSFLM